MQIKQVIKNLESKVKFKDWKNNNKESHLAHIFKMIDKINKDIWQIGYYNKNETMTTFIIENENIKIIPDQEIFQKKKHQVRKLDLEKIKFDIDEALEIFGGEVIEE